MSLFKRSGVPLSAFIRGLVKALCDGQQAIPHAREEQLECHMTRHPDGHLIPDVIEVKLHDETLLRVPAYSFSQVNTIGIKAARITCSAQVSDLHECDQCGQMNCGDSQVRFRVNPVAHGGRKSFEIEIDFERREPTEAEQRLVEALDAGILPDG